MPWFVLARDQRLFVLNKATLISMTGQYQIAVFAWYVCLFVVSFSFIICFIFIVYYFRNLKMRLKICMHIHIKPDRLWKCWRYMWKWIIMNQKIIQKKEWANISYCFNIFIFKLSSNKVLLYLMYEDLPKTNTPTHTHTLP